MWTCQYCGSEELGYKKYVECVTPVMQHGDGPLEYLTSVINEDEYLASYHGFICGNCGKFIQHCGINITTEKDLSTYNTMDPVLRAEQQAEYDAHIAAQEETQRQKDAETYVNWNDVVITETE